MQPLPLPQLLSLHRLHPLARNPDSLTQNANQQRDIQQLPAQNFASGERESSLDEMFVRDGSNRFGDQWQQKSSLRKIWEQNKIMLS